MGAGYTIFYAKRIGASCKKNNSDSIGQFGEGIKLALLTCIRNNIVVMLGIQNWLIVPYINHIENQDVLFYDIYEKMKIFLAASLVLKTMRPLMRYLIILQNIF